MLPGFRSLEWSAEGNHTNEPRFWNECRQALRVSRAWCNVLHPSSYSAKNSTSLRGIWKWSISSKVVSYKSVMRYTLPRRLPRYTPLTGRIDRWERERSTICKTPFYSTRYFSRSMLTDFQIFLWILMLRIILLTKQFLVLRFWHILYLLYVYSLLYKRNCSCLSQYTQASDNHLVIVLYPNSLIHRFIIHDQ